MNTVVDRAPGNETLLPPKEISVTRFGRHERLPNVTTSPYIPSFHRVTKHSPLSFPTRRSLTSRHTTEYSGTILSVRETYAAYGWLFAFPTIRPRYCHCVSSIFRADFSQFVALAIFSAYFFPSASIFNIHRWNFSTIFLLRSGKYRVIIYIYIYVYYIRATLKNIKLGVTVLVLRIQIRY